jgi:hypothetical protein
MAHAQTGERSEKFSAVQIFLKLFCALRSHRQAAASASTRDGRFIHRSMEAAAAGVGLPGKMSASAGRTRGGQPEKGPAATPERRAGGRISSIFQIHTKRPWGLICRP